jgi:hypothetical protein
MSTIDEGNRKATNTRGRYPASPPTFMKHKHHIIPKHLGGTNEPDNIVEVTIEQHALLHKQLWEKVLLLLTQKGGRIIRNENVSILKILMVERSEQNVVGIQMVSMKISLS